MKKIFSRELFLPIKSLIVRKDIGIITEETVKVGGIHFEKGNLVWILKQGDDKSYVRPIVIDVSSGWVKKSDIYIP